MITVKNEEIILEKTDSAFKDLVVFNPAIMGVGITIQIFYPPYQNRNHLAMAYCILNGP